MGDLRGNRIKAPVSRHRRQEREESGQSPESSWNHAFDALISVDMSNLFAGKCMEMGCTSSRGQSLDRPPKKEGKI